MWYSAGTVTVTNGQRLVTGAGTDFVSNVFAGGGFIGPDGRVYEVEQVVSATQIMLRTNYYGGSAGAQGYTIIPTQSLMKDLADAASQLIASFAGVRDGIGAGLIGDGVQTVPGIRFATDQDTGLRRYADNAMALVTSGADRLIISNAGVGVGAVNDAKSGLMVHGLDQATANLADAGDHKASLYLRAVGNGAGAGGTVLFGTTFGAGTPFAGIKGFVREGDNNTAGDIVFMLRAEQTDGSLTERARLSKEGRFGVGGIASHNLTVTGLGLPSNALADGQRGACVFVRDTGSSPGSGGAISFGAKEERAFAGLKGSLTDATANTLGNLLVVTRSDSNFGQLDPRWLWSFDGHYRPYADNTYDIGAGSLRVRQIFAANGAINTSDVRTKQQIEAIPDEWLDAWADVRHVRFKFNDSVAEKGDDARWHVGYVAQEIRDAFIAHDLDATVIGLLCHDEWEERREPEYRTETRIKRTARAIPSAGGLLDADGNPLVTWTYDEEPEEVQVATGEMIVARDAGDLWSIRPDQCAAIEAAWARREIARQGARIDALEAS